MGLRAPSHVTKARRFWIIREASGFTQTEARNLVKTSPTQMSQIESGAANPTKSAAAIEFLLQVDADFNYLFRGVLNRHGWPSDGAMYERVLELEQSTPLVGWRRNGL